jgi:alkylation response protein AidB-like acyl-CoA dehydrogenase
VTTATTIKNRNSSLHVGTGALLEAAHRLQPLLRDEAAAGEALGELTPKVVDALHENGMFGMWLPAELGGSELTPRQSLEVLEQLTYGDASAGWVVMAACLSTGTAGAYLPTRAAETLFPKDRKRLNVIAGQGTRPGKAVATDGGYIVSGAWSFGSGLKHSTYVHSAAIIESTGELRIFNPPIEKAKLMGNWDVMGLKATGSIDYTLDNVFVPEDFSHPLLIQEPKRGGSLYRIGIINFAGICHSGWALGVARRMLDDLRELTKAKMGRAAQSAANDSFQSAYGLAEAKLRAARALLFETWADIEDTLDRDEPLSTRQETLNRLALYNVTWTANDVSEFVYKAAGTTALRDGPIQRYFRDMHAGTQHVTSSPGVLQACGQELAGLAEGKRWMFLSLVDAPAGTTH